MRLVWLSTLLVLAGVGVGVPSAAAHSPYFTQVEKIELPNGEIGEMRLLHGDGIFFADPVRAVIIDGQGRAVARTRSTVPMVIVCPEAGRCHAYDFKRRLVLEPDPTTFRQGPVVADATTVWGIEPENVEWGFRGRRARISDAAAAQLAYANRHKFDLAISFMLAAIGAAVFFKRLRLSMWPPRHRWVLWIAVCVLRLSVCAVLLVLSLWSAAISGMTTLQWLGASVAGAGLMLALMWLMRWLRIRFRRPENVHARH
jgi:hypothetical protein